MNAFGICQICNEKILKIEKESFSPQDIELYESSTSCATDMGGIKLKYEATPGVYENVVPE